MSYFVKIARHATIAALFIIAALGGTLTGVVLAYADDLPLITALDNYAPHTITRVLGRDGKVVGDFAVERRSIVTYSQIPEVLRNAIVSAEDDGFFDHAGLSISRMFLALLRDIVTPGRTPGGSTVTQQLARNLFPSTIGFSAGDRSWERKIKESIVAMQIEKRYTKEEIFTMYCNQIYWGHGAYGVEAAAQVYFGKSVGDLTLEEAALIAGIIQDQVYFDSQVKPHLGQNGIDYIGSVGPGQRDELLGKASALLHLINFAEPFGLSLVEAMACGTPVVATRVGAVPDMIPGQTHGLIVPPKDQAALTIALTQALDSEWDRAAIARHGRSRSWDRVAAEVLQVMTRLCETTGTATKFSCMESAR